MYHDDEHYDQKVWAYKRLNEYGVKKVYHTPSWELSVIRDQNSPIVTISTLKSNPNKYTQ